MIFRHHTKCCVGPLYSYNALTLWENYNLNIPNDTLIWHRYLDCWHHNISIGYIFSSNVTRLSTVEEIN